MLVEEMIRKIRALPARLRFHLLFSVFTNPETSTEVLSLIDVHGSLLSELSRELKALPAEVRPLLLASELKQSLAG